MDSTLELPDVATAVRVQWRPVPGMEHLARPPRRALDTDAGYDIYSVMDAALEPGATQEIRTGIELSVPAGWYYTMEGRSSMNRRKLFVVRPIIDATYCGEAFVILRNDGAATYHVKTGDRIAQILIHRKYDMQLEQVEEFSPEYNQRGRAGFGHSGR